MQHPRSKTGPATLDIVFEVCRWKGQTSRDWLKRLKPSRINKLEDDMEQVELHYLDSRGRSGDVLVPVSPKLILLKSSS